MKKRLIFWIITLLAILGCLVLLVYNLPFASADNEQFDDVNYNEYNLYNATNVTATYFVGNGSFLTDTVSAETDPIFTAENSTIWSAILARLTSTEVNATIDSRVTQAFITALGFFTGNHTQLANSYTDTQISNNNASWSSTFNSTYATYSYNQTIPANSYADSQDTIYNDSIADFINSLISANSDSWTTTYNSTYATYSYNQTTPAMTYADSQDVIYNDSIRDYINGLISSNNASWTTTFNTTYAQFAYNQTSPAISYTDTQISNNNASWSSTFNSTYSTYAYNQTIPAMSYADSQDVVYNNSIANYINGLITANNASWSSTFNSSYATYAYNQSATEGSNISISGSAISVDTVSLLDWLTTLFLSNTGDTATGDYTFNGNINISNENNLSVGDSRTWWNGSCLNTEVQGTLIQSIGCI